ncbi:MAG: tetratricopeptide repeat protein [Anaerolineae bacterium]
MNSWRARLQLTLLAMLVLLLGLTPYPQAFAAAMRQAETLRASHEYGAAIEWYQKASRLDPDSPLPWLEIGEVLLVQHQFAPAASAFLEAERRGGKVDAVLGVGESRAGRGDWASALSEWLRALALNPEDPRVYLALGRADIALGHFEQGRDYLARALQLGPSPQDAATAHALMGRLLVGESLDLAEAEFRKAGDDDMLAVLLAVSAEQEPARQAMLWGIAFLQRGELALARRYFERAVALAPGDAEALAYLAHTLDRQGETVAAMDLLEQALALDEEPALVHYFLGIHHRLVGNLEKAQDALWQALLEDPENAALRAEMAGTFVDQGDYPAAEEWYAGAAASAPEDVDFQLMLVHFYLDHLYRVEDEGLPAAQALVSLAPDDPRAYDLLGWAYHLSGQQDEAISTLREALDRNPGLVSAHFHLGSLYAGAGQVDLARQHLQRAIDLDTSGYYRERAELILKDLE